MPYSVTSDLIRTTWIRDIRSLRWRPTSVIWMKENPVRISSSKPGCSEVMKKESISGTSFLMKSRKTCWQPESTCCSTSTPKLEKAASCRLLFWKIAQPSLPANRLCPFPRPQGEPLVFPQLNNKRFNHSNKPLIFKFHNIQIFIDSEGYY